MDVLRIEVKRVAPQNAPTIHVRTRRSSGLKRWLLGIATRVFRDLFPRGAVLTLE